MKFWSPAQRLIPLFFHAVCLFHAFSQELHPALRVPFIYYGHVFLADAEAMAISRVGSLAATAPAVALDPQGRIWGRLDMNTLGALDPTTGAVTARVALPYPVYDHVITPSGLAYVTHAALTKQGLSLSVVDTTSRRRVNEINNIAGLRTDLTTVGETAFLAVTGAGRGYYGTIRLYEIDGAAGRLTEITHSKDTRFSLRVAATDSRVYAAFVPLLGREAPARIEIRERRHGKLTYTADKKLWGGQRQLRGLYAAGSSVFLMLEASGGRHEIAVADQGLTVISAHLPLPGPINRVLAVRGTIIMYLDLPFAAGYRDVNLCFYDRNRRKEVKRINIPAYLTQKAAK